MTARGWVVALVAATAAGVAAGCGGREDDAAQPAAATAASAPANDAGTQAARPVGRESAGSVVQFADCGDWRAGSPAERRATVVALRRQLTPTRSTTAESPLRDERAHEILDKACSPSYAESLRLYKLYVRAQGFAPLND